MTFSPLTVRRLCFALPTIALAVTIALLSWRVLGGAPRSGLEWALGLLFVLVMAWESMVVVQVSLGFLSWLGGQNGVSRRSLNL